MSILYELPSNIRSLSQPSAEWIKLLNSYPPIVDSLDDIPSLRRKHTKRLQAYLAAGPEYLGETDVLVADSSYPNPATNITLPIRIYTPCDDDHPGKTYPILLWFHGGGFALGSNLVDDELLRYICHHSRIVVATADYCLAPEHAFPTAPENAWCAAKWVRENAKAFHADPNRRGFYVGGISAGGNLAAVVARRARDSAEGDFKIDGQLLGFPWLCSIHGHRGLPARLVEFSAIKECADAPVLGREMLERFEELYGSPDPKDPDFSPLWDERELKELPRAAIFVAGMDPLRDDGIAYWKALERDGYNPSIRIFPGMPHAFHMFKQMKTSREFKKHLDLGLKELMELRSPSSLL